jgi:hypothetical protein
MGGGEAEERWAGLVNGGVVVTMDDSRGRPGDLDLASWARTA